MNRQELARLYPAVRAASKDLAAPLCVEDQVIQTMPDVSPTKWHLAHTSWFFETFVLGEAGAAPDFAAWPPFDPAFTSLFNSYYQALGSPFPRPERGLLSRPTVAQVLAYRAHVDHGMGRLLEEAPAPLFDGLAARIELGLNHEEQHQELMLTDLKHVLWTNPSRPAYDPKREAGPGAAPGSAGEWLEHPGGVVEIGWEGSGFAFDNEGPRHKTLLQPFALASRLVTCGEYLEFMTDGGYDRPELWLSDGWTKAKTSSWNAPLYWERPDEGGWRVFTLAGLSPVDPAQPVGHVSFYEADAFARWKGARLPGEAEWEVLCASLSEATDRLWQWTGSPYTPYPGYRPVSGALGEYNGKFMCNQMVLRGGSLATPARHLRPTYRNFFPPEARWQFTGIRLARP